MSYRTISMFDLNPSDLVSVVHPYYQSLYLRKFKGIRYLEVHHVLLVEQLPDNDGIFDAVGEVRKDVPFSLRCHINNVLQRSSFMRTKFQSMGGARSKPQMIEQKKELSEFEKLEPLSASVVEYEKRNGLKQTSAFMSAFDTNVTATNFETTPITRGSSVAQELDDLLDIDDTYLVFSDKEISIEEFIKDTYLSTEPDVVDHFMKTNPHLKRSFHQIIEGMPLVVSPWKFQHSDEANAIVQADELMTVFLTLSSEEKKWFAQHHETTTNALLMVAASNLDVSEGSADSTESNGISLSHILAGSAGLIAGVQVQGDLIKKKMSAFADYSKDVAEKTKGLSKQDLYSNEDYKKWRKASKAFQKEMKGILSEAGKPSYIKSFQAKNINQYLNVDKRQLYKAKDFSKAISGINMTALYKQAMSFSKGLGVSAWVVTGLGLYGNGKDIIKTCYINDVISEACGRSLTKNLSSAAVNISAGLVISNAIAYGIALTPVTGGLSIIFAGVGASSWGLYGGDISNDVGSWVEELVFD